ncbi:hypothetical protein Tco_1236962 [Tanacetum coccineum]
MEQSKPKSIGPLSRPSLMIGRIRKHIKLEKSIAYWLLSIRALWGFLGVGTMYNNFPRIFHVPLVDTAYDSSWIRRIGLYIIVVACEVHAQIRRIFLDGYVVLVVRTAYS